MATSKLSRFDRYYLYVKGNRWYWYFSVLCRVLLAYAFIVAGMVKIIDERFASGLSELHPMGSYLEALHHTGYYYTFIGIFQVIAAILILIPRTITLGALIYLPIIVNIFILSFALRFEGSYVTSPLMVLANLYLLAWNYDKIRYILPFKQEPKFGIVKRPRKYSNQFPFIFFTMVIACFTIVIIYFRFGNEVMPRNTLSDCKKQFIGTKNEVHGFEFCDCIHVQGNTLDDCLNVYEKTKK